MISKTILCKRVAITSSNYTDKCHKNNIICLIQTCKHCENGNHLQSDPETKHLKDLIAKSL